MRDELKNTDWHVYGLSKEDFVYMTNVINDIAEDRKKQLYQEIETIRKENPTSADDIADDLAYYKNLELYYLFEFLLVRLIGIFEGIIEKNFIPAGKYKGYYHRVSTLKKCNLKLKNKEEIDCWVKLRNNIIHRPSEMVRPVHINENDIKELLVLLIDAVDDLEIQHNNKTSQIITL